MKDYVGALEGFEKGHVLEPINASILMLCKCQKGLEGLC
jgi:hypothetical protein